MQRFEIYLVALNPVVGSEISKSRPCVIVSPDSMNNNLKTVIVAPLTSTVREWPTRVDINFQGKNGQIALDQIRTVAKERLIKKLGKFNKKQYNIISRILINMFEI